MKKKQQSQNVYSRKDLEHLEKKFEEEKMILVKENKKLQTQIYQEIQESNLNKIIYEKNKQVCESKIQQLQAQVENLKTQLLLANQNSDQSEDEQQISMLKVNRDVILENNELKMKIQQFLDVILTLEKDNENLLTQAEKQRKRNESTEGEVEQLRQKIQEIMENYKILKEESNQTGKQLENKTIQVEEYQKIIEKLEDKLKNAKKKKKQTENTLQLLEKRMKNFQLVETNKLEIQINELRKEKEEQDQEKMTLNRKIDFLQVQLKQKKSCIQAINREVVELKDGIIQKENEMSEKIQLSQSENRRLIIETENLKSKIIKQGEEFQKNLQIQTASIKKKVAEELYAIMKTHDSSPETIEAYMEGLRGCKSHTHLRMKMNDDKKQNSFEKFKFQNQINSLESENNSLKKQIQSLNQQSIQLAKANEERRDVIDEKDKRIKELALIHEKNDHQKLLEIQRLRNEIANLKSKETEYLQMKKSQVDFELAVNEKINFYEDKIRQKIESNSRKQNTIESLKEKRMELENKCKFMEEKLAKALQDLENMKRLKADCQRKEQLMKDYREKVQKYKIDMQNMRIQLDKLRKDKVRLEKNIQSKQEYVSTLKGKLAKEAEEQEMKGQNEKMFKDMKEKYENKLRKLKKDYENYTQTLNTIKSIIFETIEECMSRSPKETEKKQGSWQAAQMLGLEAGEIQEFVNPTVNLDRHIYDDLISCWEKGEVESFVRSSLEYIALKNQQD